jgi:hypothetical protein
MFDTFPAGGSVAAFTAVSRGVKMGKTEWRVAADSAKRAVG